MTERRVLALMGTLLAAACVASAGEVPREQLETRLMRLEAQLMRLEVAGNTEGGPAIAALERQMKRLRRELRRNPRSEVAGERRFLESLEARLKGVRTGAPLVYAAGTASISGTVRDSVTSAGIPNVNVVLYKANCGDGLLSFIGSFATNASGVYTTAANLDSGDYYLFTDALGPHVNAIHGGPQCVGVCSSYAALRTGSKVTVTSGAATGIDFSLRVGGRVSGAVTNETTLAAVPSATISVYTETGVWAGYTNADGGGLYVTAGLPAGTYLAASELVGNQGLLNEVYSGVPCVGGNFCVNITSGTLITVVDGVTTPNINFSLTPGGRITGQALPAAANASVDIFDSTGILVSYGYAVSGSYQSIPVRPGNYYLRTFNYYGYVDETYNNKACLVCDVVATGDPVTVTGAANTPGINFDLAVGGLVSGTVNAGGPACGDCFVDLYDSSSRIVAYGYTDLSGSYTTFQGLPTASYYAKASGGFGAQSPWVPQVWNGITCVGCTVTSGTPISVTQGSMAGNVNFNLNAGSRIVGTITNALDGASIAGGRADVYTLGGTLVATGRTTCPTGGYATDGGFPAGSYYVRGSAYPYRTEQHSNVDCGTSCSFGSGTPVAVNGTSDSAPVNFGLVRFHRRADMDADGHSDLVWRETTGALYIWQMEGAGLAGSSYLPPISTNWVVQAVADFDGDLSADILWREAGSGLTYIWLMNGPRKLGEGYTTLYADNTWTIQGTGDFDGDGRADILWRHTSGAMYIWMMKGTAVVNASFLPPISLAWTVQRLGDFDGDGRADILWRETASGSSYLWLMDGATAIGQGYTASQTDNSWVVQGVGDLGGDGRADIVWRHTGGALAIWAMNGTAVLSASLLPPITTNWVVKGIADYSGEGRADILWREMASGVTYLWLMNGATKVGEGYTQAQANTNWTITTQP